MFWVCVVEITRLFHSNTISVEEFERWLFRETPVSSLYCLAVKGLSDLCLVTALHLQWWVMGEWVTAGSWWATGPAAPGVSQLQFTGQGGQVGRLFLCVKMMSIKWLRMSIKCTLYWRLYTGIQSNFLAYRSKSPLWNSTLDTWSWRTEIDLF